MPWSTSEMDRQLSRQSLWLRESYTWLLDQKVLREWSGRDRPTALDVGCGPGYVMEALGPRLHIQGIDIDPAAVHNAVRRGLDVREGDAHTLPFEDRSFDVVYCSFLILWVKDPSKVLSEMVRVARDWVICLAEPDIGARVNHPEELSALSGIACDGVRAEGGDPLTGRKLRSLFRACGLEAEIGIHPGVWGIDKLREESEGEWRYLELTAKDDGQRGTLSRLKPVWDRALKEGTLFQFNPIFYAFGRTHASHR